MDAAKSAVSCLHPGGMFTTAPLGPPTIFKHTDFKSANSHRRGSVRTDTSAAENLGPFRAEMLNSGPEECTVPNSGAHNRKWRRARRWLVGTLPGVRNLVLLLVDHLRWVLFFLTDGRGGFSIIYSASDELLKVWFGHSIFNVLKCGPYPQQWRQAAWQHMENAWGWTTSLLDFPEQPVTEMEMHVILIHFQFVLTSVELLAGSFKCRVPQIVPRLPFVLTV